MVLRQTLITVTQKCNGICTKGQNLELMLEFFQSAKVAMILLAEPVKIAPTFVIPFWMVATWRSLLLDWWVSLPPISGFTVGTATLSQFDRRPYLSSFSLNFPSPRLAEHSSMACSVDITSRGSLTNWSPRFAPSLTWLRTTNDQWRSRIINTFWKCYCLPRYPFVSLIYFFHTLVSYYAKMLSC